MHSTECETTERIEAEKASQKDFKVNQRENGAQKKTAVNRNEQDENRVLTTFFDSIECSLCCSVSIVFSASYNDNSFSMDLQFFGIYSFLLSI